jgi:hypothetical protein
MHVRPELRDVNGDLCGKPRGGVAGQLQQTGERYRMTRAKAQYPKQSSNALSLCPHLEQTPGGCKEHFGIIRGARVGRGWPIPQAGKGVFGLWV